MLNLFWQELRSRFGALIGWGIGLAAFGSLYIGLYPEVEAEMSNLADLSIYGVMGMDIGSFEGFIASIVAVFLPLILGIYAIISSTGTLAGEEEAGTLELILAMPLRRWQIVSVKAIALGIITYLILIVTGLGSGLTLSLISTQTDVEVTPMQLLGVITASWPLIFAFCMMGLFLGAYLPSRRVASLTLTVLFIASYFAENLAGMVESLDPIKPFTLFTYLDSTATVFSQGVKASDVLTLLVVAAVFFLLAVLSFERRNITVGAWPWQRPRPAE
jgi:ABC-2 type transport system permease protein